MVLIWIMPIYALDLGNSTSNLNNNTSKDYNQTHNFSDGYYDKILKTTSAGKFKDMQDLQLKILHILEGLCLLRRQNGDSYAIRYYTELERESEELKSLSSSLIRC